MNRRRFLAAMLGASAAPAIVRAGSLMRINPEIVVVRSLLTPSIIAAEALAELEAQLKLMRLIAGHRVWWDEEVGEIKSVTIRPREIYIDHDDPFGPLIPLA